MKLQKIEYNIKFIKNLKFFYTKKKINKNSKY